MRKVETDKQAGRRPRGQRQRDARGRRETKQSAHAKTLAAARKAALRRREAGESIDPQVTSQVEAAVRAGRRKGSVEGRRRFYFDSRDGRVPYLELNDEVISEIETGAVAIVESESGKTAIITADAAVAVMTLDVDWLRRWNA